MSEPERPAEQRRRDVQRRAAAEARGQARHRGGDEPRREPRHRGTAESRRQTERLEAAEDRLEVRRQEEAEDRLEDERIEAQEALRRKERLDAAESRRNARSQVVTLSRREARSQGSAESRRAVRGQGDADARRDVRHRAMVTPMLRESVIVTGLALLVSLLVKTWLLQAFFIPSGSMENTLVKDDRVIVNKLVPSRIAVKRGDIVVFADPGGWLPPARPLQHSRLTNALSFVGLLPSDEGNHLIKRVIGLPGDQVVCCDQNEQITVNGVAITEPYLKTGDVPSQEPFKITVPAGRVWVMGDHRSDSGDSRPHDENSGGAKGSVPESLIVGRAVALVWPREHWTWLGNPTQTFAVTPPATAR